MNSSSLIMSCHLKIKMRRPYYKNAPVFIIFTYVLRVLEQKSADYLQEIIQAF